MDSTRVALCAALWVVGLIFAAPAPAATVVGQAPPGAGTPSPPCLAGDRVQVAVSSGPGYIIPPGAGVITRWMYAAGAQPSSQIALRLFTRQDATSTLTAVAEDVELMQPSMLNSFPVRIPVAGGELLGLRLLTDNVSCGYEGFGGGDAYFSLSPSPPLNVPALFTPQSGARMNIAAVVEPDADQDRFGDESQDCAPTDARRHDDCVAPRAKIVARPKKKTRSRRAEFVFRSNDPSARFECRLDRKPFKRCASPRVLKHLKAGKHRFRVRAIDAVGNVGPPAKFRWRILVA